MPVHGEWRHLRAHAELGRSAPASAPTHRAAEDGVVVDLVDGQASIVGASRAATSTSTGSPSATSASRPCKDRRILGDEGFISLTVAVDCVTGKIAGGPADRRARLHRRTRRRSTTCCRSRARARTGRLEGVADTHQLAQFGHAGCSATGSSDTYRRRPMIIPVVVEV